MLPYEIILGVIRRSVPRVLASWILVARPFTKPAIQAYYQDLYVGNVASLTKLATLTACAGGLGSETSSHETEPRGLVLAVCKPTSKRTLPLQWAKELPVWSLNAAETSHARLLLIARPGRPTFKIEKLALDANIALESGFSVAAGKALASVRALTLAISLDSSYTSDRHPCEPLSSLSHYLPRLQHLGMELHTSAHIGSLAMSERISGCKQLESIHVDLRTHYMHYYRQHANGHDIFQDRHVRRDYYWIIRLFLYSLLMADLPKLRTIRLVMPWQSEWVPRKLREDTMQTLRGRTVNVTYTQTQPLYVPVLEDS